MQYTKDYYENFVKNTLEFYFPKKFYNLQKSECPDWTGEHVGIEVTRALSTNEGSIDAFIKKYHGKKYSELPKRRLENLGFKGEPIKSNIEIFYDQRSKENGTLTYLKLKNNDLILFRHAGGFGLVTDCVGPIIKAVKEKITKLNSHYSINDENDLAVLVQEQLNYLVLQDEIINEVLDKLIENLKKLSKECTFKTFNYLYVIFYDNIFVINLKDYSYNRVIISKDDLLTLSKLSFENEE